MNDDPAEVLIRRLRTRARLGKDDVAALNALRYEVREVLPNAYLVRERQHPTRCALVLSGYAFRQKLTIAGGRQIVGILVPGDFTDLQQLFLRQADHNVQALTRLRVAEIPVEAMRALATGSPGVARALWIDTLIEGSIMRELALNIGRRDAASRIAHLLCEFEVRLRAAGLAEHGYELPMTQEQIGDAVGLTAVHVNRTFKMLEKEGLIERAGRFVRIVERDALMQRADFDPLYLHLDQVSTPT